MSVRNAPARLVEATGQLGHPVEVDGGRPAAGSDAAVAGFATELASLARGLAQQVGAEAALVAVWDGRDQVVRGMGGWRVAGGAEQLTVARGEGFLGRLLDASTPVVERVDSRDESALAMSGRGSVITHAVGAPIRSPRALGAVCAGLASPPAGSRETLAWAAGAYAVVAGLLLEGSPLFNDLLAAASSDALTGCLNYAGLRGELEAETKRCERHGRRLSCCFIDLDGFKSVNDVNGHPGGNRVLATVAAALRATVRDSDAVGRYGGDEFVVVLPETSQDVVLPLALRLRAAMRRASAEMGAPVDASFGIAEWRPGDSVDDLLERADDMLRGAKRTGPGSIAADGRITRPGSGSDQPAGTLDASRMAGEQHREDWELLARAAARRDGEARVPHDDRRDG